MGVLVCPDAVLAMEEERARNRRGVSRYFPGCCVHETELARLGDGRSLRLCKLDPILGMPGKLPSPLLFASRPLLNSFRIPAPCGCPRYMRFAVYTHRNAGTRYSPPCSPTTQTAR